MFFGIYTKSIPFKRWYQNVERCMDVYFAMFDGRLFTKLGKQNSVNNTWKTLFTEIKGGYIEMELNIDFTFRNPVSRFFLKDFLKKNQNKKNAFSTKWIAFSLNLTKRTYNNSRGLLIYFFWNSFHRSILSLNMYFRSRSLKQACEFS